MIDTEWIEERAGIREFDGGLPREIAERAAKADVKLWYLRNKPTETESIPEAE